MLKQIIDGKTINTINAEISSVDISAILPILTGKIEVYEQKGKGGVAIMPAILENGLNSKSISVGKKELNNQFKSVFFRLPHVKPTKSILDLQRAIKGQFDIGYETKTKCEYVNEYYDGYNKGGK